MSLFLQAGHLLIEPDPKLLAQPTPHKGGFLFEIVARDVHDSYLVLRLWGRAPIVFPNGAAPPNVRGNPEPSVVTFLEMSVATLSTESAM